jgi:hypothetical protein
MIRGWFVKDTKNKAGQVINNPGHLIRREKQLNEKYLHEYIARKTPPEEKVPLTLAVAEAETRKRLTFDEWFNDYAQKFMSTDDEDSVREDCRKAWNAAQENK